MPGNKVEFKLTGDWKKMSSALDPKRFQANLESNLGRATAFNGMMVASEIRKRIKSRKYAKNAPLTVLIKKSSTPLVDDGDLFGAVTSKTLDKYSVFVGILRSAVSSDGHSLTNLAELLHNGGTVQVTESMRGMFILLYEVGQGKREASTLEGRTAELAKALGSRIKQIRPLKPTTKYINIPPRPFLTSVLNDPVVLKRCKRNWEKAARAAFKDQTSGSSKGGKAGSTVPATAGRRQAKAKIKKPRNRSEAARKGWATRRAKGKKEQP